MTTQFPKVAIGATYYSTLHREFSQSLDHFLQAGLPIVEIRGCAYQEMSRGELCRRALVRHSEGLQCLVLIDDSIATTPEAVRQLADCALKTQSIAIASVPIEAVNAGHPTLMYAHEEYLDPGAFMAIPLDALEHITRYSRARDARSYQNTPTSSQLNPETEFYPLFSPFTAKGESVLEGVRLRPDVAFLARASRACVNLCSVQVPFKRLKTNPIALRTTNWQASNRDQFAIAVACYGGLDADQRKLLFELQKYGCPIVELFDHPHVDTARDILATEVLDAGFSGMVFIDHDIMFTPLDVLSLAVEARDRAAVVSVPYCMRKSGHSIIGAFDSVEAGNKVTYFEGAAVRAAAYTGMGFTAIDRSIIESVAEQRSETLRTALGKVHPMFSLMVANGFYAGEDVSFCNRVHDLETAMTSDGEWQMRSKTPGKVFLDPRKRIFHKGSYLYGLEDAGMVVPRVSTLTAVVTKNAAETRAMLRAVDTLPTDLQAAALGVAEDTPEDARHPLISEPEAEVVAP